MALRINTNIAALNAHSNLKKTDNSLSKSLERLSSGLRINRSADDAAGMSIANVLKAQSVAIGQAVKNANDGISIVQIADAALDESVNILNTIKTKSIQAAQDGQTLESRKAIQADIDKLMAELDDIAKTTTFGGQKLLSGNFVNKKFQVGAFSGQTVDLNIGSAESSKIGHVTTGILETSSSGGGEVRLGIYSNYMNAEVAIQSVTLAYDNSADNSMGALADAINKVSSDTGVTAQAVVESTSNAAVAAGSTGSSFSINGVEIGELTVLANDSDGSLVNAINQKSSQHGVTASVDEVGYLTLASNDGRAIQVSGDSGTTLLGSDLNTFGHIKLFQTGANEIKISDDADMVSLNLTGSLGVAGDTNTVVDSTLAKDSVIASASVLKAGSTLGFVMTSGTFSGDITTTLDSTLKAGSVLGSGSTIAEGTILGGTVTQDKDGTLTVTSDSLLKAGSSIASGTVIAAGTVVTTRLAATTGWIEAGTTLGSDITLSNTATLVADMTVSANSVLAAASSYTAGSYLGADLLMASETAATMTVGMTLLAGSTIVDDSAVSITEGSVIGGDVTTASTAVVTVISDMTLKAGSTIGDHSQLAKGSTIGGYTTVSGSVTLAGDMTLAAGSQLATGTLLKAGTVLTDDIWTAGSNLLKAGTVLTGDTYTFGTNYLDAAMTLKAQSVVADGSVFAPTATSSSGATASTSLSDVERYRLSDIDVTSQESAQVAITIVDSALSNVNKIKSDLGSAQNQLTSTIANLTTTQVNIISAESTIRDVDFAEESANFTKMQILMQAGTFAMAQANVSAQNVLQLLQ
jgi:flagellin